ncbi:hypothetical protein PHAVU_003G120100 [Phaseolus vulgaris]|uniref:SMAX1-like AAA+ ATPase lid domain-containing protein n=1 Tax=Phaseolus vulgaris TaxID=3885 RepID=V7C8D6_PHAVU|nr:hypothetical protein PHAVU_003G120100g [Phaseolus vulgaris]ESW26442.1 hypothetical protein PHAVU_003G120100g [Phaseolus vulgaris]
MPKSRCYVVLRRKTIVDYIAGELSKKLHSVCLYCKCRRSLLQAVRKGNFPDSHGRAISIHNTIFIAASTVCKGSGSLVSDESKMFSEERILEAKSFYEPSSLNKRKQTEISESKEGTSKMHRQDSEPSRSYLDLNKPVEEGDEGVNDNDQESESITENKETWAFGSELQLEIDNEVMTGILAAAWLSDKKNAVENWVDHVFGRCFVEAQRTYHPVYQNVVKLSKLLVYAFLEEQAPGVCLPARINLD